MHYYRVKGICPIIDGLVVESPWEERGYSSYSLAQVIRIFDTNTVVGGKELLFPITGDALYLNPQYLEETDDPTQREYASDNPNGEYLYDKSISKGEIRVVQALYQNVLCVSVFHKEKMIYTQNFYRLKETVQEVITIHIMSGDPDDLVFDLKSLKEAELDGQREV
jgi:hypothetical protein